jgi:acyl-CoA dehydrogenase
MRNVSRTEVDREHVAGADPAHRGAQGKARAEGLWNLFLPESEYGAGLTNTEYAPLCEIMGRAMPFAPEIFQLLCARHREHGGDGALRDAEQKRQWLEPLSPVKSDPVLR